MAAPRFQYRAGEPSQLETGLALGALKPEQSGMAMAMLPGAASIRQDLGAAAGAAADREALLAEMTQQETARHQRSGDATSILALQNPGATAMGMTLPINDPLFAGAPQGTYDIANQQMQGQFRAQNASTQDKLADSYYKGVQSGYRTPTDVASGQMGYGLDIQAPEAEKLANIHAAAKGAGGADTLKYVQYALVSDANGNTKWTATHIPPGLENEAQTTVVRRNQDLAKGAMTPEGADTVATPQQNQEIQAVPTSKRGIIKPPVTVRQGSSTASAGAALQTAPTQQAQGATPQAATQGRETITPVAPPRGGKELLAQFVSRRVAKGEDIKTLNEAVRTGQIRFGKGSSGTTYIIEPGKQAIPLTPQ